MQLQKQMEAKDVAGINGCPTCAFEITGDGYMEGEVVTCWSDGGRNRERACLETL